MGYEILTDRDLPLGDLLVEIRFARLNGIAGTKMVVEHH